MSQMRLPETTDALIDLLDKWAFPYRNLPPETPSDVMHRHFGTRDVVDFLKALRRERDEAGPLHVVREED